MGASTGVLLKTVRLPITTPSSCWWTITNWKCQCFRVVETACKVPTSRKASQMGCASAGSWNGGPFWEIREPWRTLGALPHMDGDLRMRSFAWLIIFLNELMIFCELSARTIDGPYAIHDRMRESYWSSGDDVESVQTFYSWTKIGRVSRNAMDVVDIVSGSKGSQRYLA